MYKHGNIFVCLVVMAGLNRAFAATVVPSQNEIEAFKNDKSMDFTGLSDEEITRKKRMFSLFAVVTFPQDSCTSKSDTTMSGTCMSTTECSDASGTADGNCASGFGVCCTFSISACGGTVTNNCTYISNVGFPSTITTTATSTCTYTVNSAGSNICQVRLDFTNAVIGITAASGVCVGTITATSPTLNSPPAVCGTLTGQHMYYEIGRLTTASTIAIVTGIATSSWKIKVSQIECDNLGKAPTDCTQYHTGVSGTIESYGFPGGLAIASQDYSHCIRQEQGMCSINYSVATITTPTPFFLQTAVATTNAETSACTLSRLNIPLSGNDQGSNFYCGGLLSIVDADTIAGAVVSQTQPPFTVSFQSGAPSLTLSTGYQLVYTQQSC